MPKTYPETQPKKSKAKKTKLKAQPTPVSLLRRKSYWITLTTVTVVFGVVYGYLMNVSLVSEVLMLSSALSLIAFVFHMGYKPSTKYSKRATFISGGACILGFSIWVVMVLALNAVVMQPQITSLIGDNLFVLTSLIICMTAGAFIGDLIGKNRENLSILVNRKLRK